MVLPFDLPLISAFTMRMIGKLIPYLTKVNRLMVLVPERMGHKPGGRSCGCEI